MAGRHDNLVAVIGSDLYHHAKWSLLLLVAISVTGIGIVMMTHNTRTLIDRHDKLILEQNKLNVEWRNLILEEEVWGKQNRVLQIAIERLGMNYVEPDQEVIVIEQQER